MPFPLGNVQLARTPLGRKSGRNKPKFNSANMRKAQRPLNPKPLLLNLAARLLAGSRAIGGGVDFMPERIQRCQARKLKWHEKWHETHVGPFHN